MAVRYTSVKIQKSVQKSIAVIIVALLISMLMMIPQVAKAIASLFTKTKEEAAKLAKQLSQTAAIVAFTLTGLLLVGAAGFFLPIAAPVVVTLGLVVVGLGVWSLARNWKVIKDDKFDANKMLQDQVKSGVDVSLTD